MAGNLPVPNGVQVRLFFLVGSARWAINVLHFRNISASPIDLTRATSIDGVLTSAFTTSGIAGVLGTVVNFGGIAVRDMASNTNPDFTPSRNGVFGTATGNLLPPQTSLVATLRTALRGRSYQGRTYVWGFTEDANDANGVASATALTATAAWLNAIRTGLVGAPSALELSILSRFHTPPGATAPVERNPPVLTPVVNAITLDARWDTQRRRAIAGV